MRTACGCIALFAALSAQGSASAPLDRLSISQQARRFAPAAVSLKIGETLKILNDDRFTHHVYYEVGSAKFDSGAQKPGQTVELNFKDAGVFPVRCAIHPKMRLDVTVEK